MNIYVSGPITGLSLDYAERTFAEAADELTAAGHTPVNPMAVTPYNPEWVWEQYMRADLRLVLDCDGMAMLPMWESSRGAMLERTVALACGLDVRPLTGWVTP